MKKIIALLTLVVLVSGCATHQQANTAVGAGTGAVIGAAIAGRGGAAVGAIIGSSIGSQQPTQSQPVIIEQGYTYPAYTVPHRIVPNYQPCYGMSYQQQSYCRRGAEAAARQEQNRLNQEAYRRGLRGY